MGEGKGVVIGLFGGWDKEHNFDVFAILGFFAERIGCFRRDGTTYQSHFQISSGLTRNVGNYQSALRKIP